MNPKSLSNRRRLSLWHIFVVLVGAFAFTGALADRRYTLAAVLIVVVAGGLAVAARMRKLRASLRGDDDREHR